MLAPYGTDLENQKKMLEMMHDTIQNMKAVGKTSLMPFHKGYLMTLNAVQGLYKDMNDNYGLRYILTSRLNQDCLENFFAQLRGLGHHYDHPTPMEFKYRFRLLLISKNSVDLSNSCVQRDDQTTSSGTQESTEGDNYLSSC